MVTAVLNSDGSGISYELDCASDTSLSVYNFTWSARGDHLIIMPSDGSGLATVQALIANEYIATVTSVNINGQTEESILVKDISERDDDLLGNWTLTGATLNNASQSISGSAAFASDGTGATSYSVITLSFNWFTCSGWLFTYLPARSQISTSYEYVAAGNTLTLTLKGQGSATENVLVLTFTKN